MIWTLETELLTNAQLATMVLRHVVFHDVPNQRGDGGAQVVLATDPTEIDANRRRLLHEKLTRTLDSRFAYGMVFQSQPSSIVPGQIRSYTSGGYVEAKFINFSQALALHLFEVQTAAVSAGLLCVIDIVVGGRHGVVLMKLEREAGAELKMKQAQGKTQFEMSVLDSLVLTGNTRLYKAAAFLRSGPGDEEFEMVACDNQHSTTDTKEMARFWRKYLGCDLEEAARVTTSKFFKAAMDFINERVDNPEFKTVMYESLHSELRSAKPTVVPRTFITDYVPEEVRPQFRAFLEERNVSMNGFEKDNQDINGPLRRLTYVSKAGVRVTAPEGRGELIQVNPEQIIVNDRLGKLGNT